MHLASAVDAIGSTTPHHLLEQRCGWCGRGYQAHDPAACGHPFWAVVWSRRAA